MKFYTATSGAASFIRSNNSIEIEFQTTEGEQIFVSIPAGVDCDLLEGDDHGDGSLESAVVDASYHRNVGAAFAMDRGAA